VVFEPCSPLSPEPLFLPRGQQWLTPYQFYPKMKIFLQKTYPNKNIVNFSTFSFWLTKTELKLPVQLAKLFSHRMQCCFHRESGRHGESFLTHHEPCE